jgi:hypothetical protein
MSNIASIVAIFTSIGGLIISLRSQKAAKELALNRRRSTANSPFLKKYPYSALTAFGIPLFLHPYPPAKPQKQTETINSRTPGLLTRNTSKANPDHPPTHIILPFLNVGYASPNIIATLDKQPIEIYSARRSSAPLGGEDSAKWLECKAKIYYAFKPDEAVEKCLVFRYPYDTSKHCTKQTLHITFQTADGAHDTHTYKTRHGCFILIPQDPPRLKQSNKNHFTPINNTQ